MIKPRALTALVVSFGLVFPAASQARGPDEEQYSKHQKRYNKWHFEHHRFRNNAVRRGRYSVDVFPWRFPDYYYRSLYPVADSRYIAAKRRCANRYRSYDWDSDTYTTYGGRKKVCRYVRHWADMIPIPKSR